ncbi:MAG: hypothetical protein J1F01_05500 [Oscillospiraceae bacterium]|nr:hypothetical protein [Oscillospiraceae bacterium]
MDKGNKEYLVTLVKNQLDLLAKLTEEAIETQEVIELTGAMESMVNLYIEILTSL